MNQKDSKFREDWKKDEKYKGEIGRKTSKIKT